MENRCRALLRFAMAFSAGLFAGVGARTICLVFCGTAAPGAYAGHHRQLPGAGVLDFDCGHDIGGSNAADPNSRNPAGADRRCCGSNARPAVPGASRDRRAHGITGSTMALAYSPEITCVTTCAPAFYAFVTNSGVCSSKLMIEVSSHEKFPNNLVARFPALFVYSLFCAPHGGGGE